MWLKVTHSELNIMVEVLTVDPGDAAAAVAVADNQREGLV